MYKLCIDAGASKIAYRFYEKDNIINNEIAFEGNLVTNEEKAMIKIIEIVNTFKGYNDIKILIGIAGGLSNLKASLQLEECIRTFNFVKSVKVLPDIYLSSISSMQNKDGLVGVIGTGVGFVNKTNNEFEFYGGYGYILGDIGSGFYFGKLLIQKYIDYTSHYTSNEFTNLIEDYFEVKNPREIINIIMQDVRNILPKLTKEFIDNDICQRVTTKFLHDLTNELEKAMFYFNVDSITLNGSLLKSKKVVECFEKRNDIKISSIDMLDAVLYYE